MKYLFVRLLVVSLAFLIGVSANLVWTKRQAILDGCAYDHGAVPIQHRA